MRKFTKKFTVLLLAALMVFCSMPMAVSADSGEAGTVKYTADDYTQAQNALADAKENYQNGAVLFLDSLMNDEEYYIENQIKKISQTTDSNVMSSYKTYGSKYYDQFTFSNLRKQAVWLDELNTRRAGDDNFTAEANRSALRLSPELIGVAMMSAMISSNQIVHTLFSTSDTNLVNLGRAENLSWGYVNPLKGWYDEEKEIYDSKSSGVTGHYTNCMGDWNRNETGVVGFGITDFGLYGGCAALRFSDVYKSTAYTADEWRNKVSEYETELQSNIQNAEKHLAEITKSFEDNGQFISKASLSTTEYTYNGKAHKPSVKVTAGKTELTKDDYTVTYSSGCKNVGKYKVTVKGKGNYIGSKTLYFKINPKAASIYKLSKGKKSFKISWKKVSAQATGYQIQYALNSKFTKSKQTVTVKSYKTTSKSITKLKAKKKYYVRVRTYKKVGDTTYYSNWSKSKTVTTKQ